MALLTKTYIYAKETVCRLRDDEDGATAIEYGLIAALIAVAIAGAVGFVGDELNNLFTNVNDKLNDAQ